MRVLKLERDDIWEFDSYDGLTRNGQRPTMPGYPVTARRAISSL